MKLAENELKEKLQADPILEEEYEKLPKALQDLSEQGADPYSVVNHYTEGVFSQEDIVSAWEQFRWTGSLDTAMDEYMWNSN